MCLSLRGGGPLRTKWRVALLVVVVAAATRDNSDEVREPTVEGKHPIARGLSAENAIGARTGL